MSVSIPIAGGVPGISGPPDWLSGGAGQSFQLDDVRWCGASKQTFTAGAANGVFFRAIHGSFSGQEYLFLTFRAGFVPDMNFLRDFVYLGLQKHGTTDAIVIRIQAHNSAFTAAGSPSVNAPAHAFSVQVKKSTAGGAFGIIGTPTWVDVPADGIRVWLQSNTDLPVDDPNFRWGVQMRIPMRNVGNIEDNAGPNLGADYDMWYVIRGSVGGNPTILAEYRADGGSTTALNLNNGIYPLPSNMGTAVWDEFLSTAGPAAFGGVTMEGNWSNDVVIDHGMGVINQTINNGQPNTFVARPRNYRDAIPANVIAAGDIAATFRIANWGSVGGNPLNVDWATGIWDYIDGNDDLNPVLSNAAIPTLAGGSPPPATSPIKLENIVMNLGPNKSLHQCILVTLVSPNGTIKFLQDSVFQNMNYDHASVIERQAEISIVGLKQFSAAPRDVYLALEKVNMRPNTPGANEGQFLQATMNRLIEKGGPLGAKLRKARAQLSDTGSDFGSATRLQDLLNSFRLTLRAGSESDTPEIDALISALSDWFPHLKQNKNAAKAAANPLRKLAIWLGEPGDADTKLASFKTALTTWLSGINNDSASLQLLPAVLGALNEFIGWRFGEDALELAASITELMRWLNSNRTPQDLASAINSLGKALQPLSNVNNQLRNGVTAFVDGAAGWLVGTERLDALVDALVRNGVTEAEMDNIFPTFRIHVYHDTGERVVEGGQTLPVLRAQSTFGVYAYHEGTLEGWQTSIKGAQRIADNLYLLAVPNNGTATITTLVQAVDNEQDRIPEDPIKPLPPPDKPPGCGCLGRLFALFGKK